MSNLGTRNLFCYLLFGSDYFLTTKLTNISTWLVQGFKFKRASKFRCAGRVSKGIRYRCSLFFFWKTDTGCTQGKTGEDTQQAYANHECEGRQQVRPSYLRRQVQQARRSTGAQQDEMVKKAHQWGVCRYSLAGDGKRRKRDRQIYFGTVSKASIQEKNAN